MLTHFPTAAAVAAEDAVRAALDMYKRHVPEAFEKRACPKNSVCYPDGYQSCMDSCQGGCPSFGCQIGCSGSCTDICSKC